jgi:hypothetical protein
VKRWFGVGLLLRTLGCGAPTVPSCIHHTDCGSCVSDDTQAGGACGWCKSKSTCAHGTQDGPDDGSCTTSDWAWKLGQCG